MSSQNASSPQSLDTNKYSFSVTQDTGSASENQNLWPRTEGPWSHSDEPETEHPLKQHQGGQCNRGLSCTSHPRALSCPELPGDSLESPAHSIQCLGHQAVAPLWRDSRPLPGSHAKRAMTIPAQKHHSRVLSRKSRS